MLLNCGVGEDSWEFLGLQGDPPVHPKGAQSWIFIGRTDAEAETSILWPPDGKNWLIWKRPWCWERLRAGGEEGDRGWDCWMASPTEWTWIWVNSGSWWCTGRLSVLQSMGSQRVRHDWATGLTYWQDITSLNLRWCPGCSCLWGSGGKSTSKLIHSKRKSVSCSCRTEVSNSLTALGWGLLLAVSSCLSSLQLKTGVSAFF